MGLWELLRIRRIVGDLELNLGVAMVDVWVIERHWVKVVFVSRSEVFGLSVEAERDVGVCATVKRRKRAGQLS